ncbi:MAG: LPS assembly lipoprotein LptE [Candidatus Cloacimonetes bacterium]|nr:LPS assembly lipoprotein LptE [Candidatus Cloacimonadota bacterium]
MKYIYLFVAIILVLTASCSYSVYTNAYPHIKNIQILSFENKSSEYQISQEFHSYLVNKYQQDGRLKISTLNPDSQIEGTINDYRKEILSYDNMGNIIEYKVSILFDITFTDLKMNAVIYNNQSLLVTESYTPNLSDSNPNIYTTEGQAQEKIYEKVFDTIMKNTLEKW